MMNCDRVQPLVPVYLDGELREELARPLRQHLLECQACRDVVAETKSLSSWFVPTPEVAVPQGFAANVARRAFAGAGEPEHVLVPAVAGSTGAAGSGPGGTAGGQVIDGAHRFAMNMVAAAAAVLAVFTLWLANEDTPSLSGTSLNAAPTEAEAVEALRKKNEAEAEALGIENEAKDEADEGTEADGR